MTQLDCLSNDRRTGRKTGRTAPILPGDRPSQLGPTAKRMGTEHTEPVTANHGMRRLTRA
eukprot:755138-Hanusia_phi.AAC.2